MEQIIERKGYTIYIDEIIYGNQEKIERFPNETGRYPIVKFIFEVYDKDGYMSKYNAWGEASPENIERKIKAVLRAERYNIDQVIDLYLKH